MPYKSFQPKQAKKSAKKSIIFLGVFLLVLLTIFPSLFGGFSSLANSASTPLWSAGEGSSSGILGFFSMFRSKRALYEQNRALTDKVSDLEQKLSGYDFVVQENIELKDVFSQKPEKTVLSRIISRPNVTAYDTFLIDTGKDGGISKGAKVFAGDTALIGIVEEVYARSSKARLFSTAGATTNVFLGPENIPAELFGMGGGSFFVEIPKDVDVKEGDIAMLSDDPEHITAYIVSREKELDNSFVKFYLQSPANLFNIKYVSVEK
ncbi:MAG: rod shape-determining protein MreC [Candidatus Paceibacterota bacterium]|jgi:cell shape-determining protein MreC|nr:rod shape-determining protein MreC [Candidatus Paceibacterota bacterium]